MRQLDLEILKVDERIESYNEHLFKLKLSRPNSKSVHVLDTFIKDYEDKIKDLMIVKDTLTFQRDYND